MLPGYGLYCFLGYHMTPEEGYFSAVSKGVRLQDWGLGVYPGALRVSRAILFSNGYLKLILCLKLSIGSASI